MASLILSQKVLECKSCRVYTNLFDCPTCGKPTPGGEPLMLAILNELAMIRRALEAK